MIKPLTKEQINTVLQALYELGIINSKSIKPNKKPGHGSCCTCQSCGYEYSECVCGDNSTIESIKELGG